MNCLESYVALLERLSLDNLEELDGIVSKDISFSDPFNQVVGSSRYIGLLKEMFEKLTAVKFNVHEQVYQKPVANRPIDKSQIATGEVAYLYWTFSAESKVTGHFSVEGVSRLEFDQSGRVIVHQDFWDSLVLLQKFPLLGLVLRSLKYRMAYQG